MKIKEIVTKKDKDLIEKVQKLEDDLIKMRLQIATKESDKFADIAKTKRTISRIKTILREREISREEEKNEKKI